MGASLLMGALLVTLLYTGMKRRWGRVPEEEPDGVR